MGKHQKLLMTACSFMLCFLLMTLFFSARTTNAATQSFVLENNQLISPVEGTWFYRDRNCIEDFQEYLIGSAPNITLTGTQGTGAFAGIGILSDYVDVGDPVLEIHSNESRFYGLANTVATADNKFILTTHDNAHTEGFFEMMLFLAKPTSLTGSWYFYPEFDGNTQYSFRIQDGGFFGGYYHLQLAYYNGAGWTNAYNMQMTNFSSYNYINLHVTFNYMFNSFLNFNLYNMTTSDTHELLYSSVFTPYQILAGSDIKHAAIFMQANNVPNAAFMLMAFDSSSDPTYFEHRMLYPTDKTLITYNAELLLSFHVATNLSQETRVITNVEIKSSLPTMTFISLLTKVFSDGEGEDNFINIDDFETISTDVYTETATEFYVNTKYRTKTLNSFNNTIYLNVTVEFILREPTFFDMLLLVIPAVLLLLIPSAVGYVKFKRNGFMLMFFVMTLILTILNIIPSLIGVLMIAVEAVLFLKLLSKGKGDEE